MTSPSNFSRRRKALAGAAAILVLIGLLLLFARLDRRATVRAYFWFESLWIEHWPFERGRWAVQDLVPVMCKLGILGPVRREVEPGVSFLLDPRDLVPVTILRIGKWQPEVWDSVSPVLSQGSVFLDVGAHIGYFSLKASVRVGPTGHVVAFEPNPETLKLLRDNIAVSKAANVIVEPIACTDREQTLTLYAAPIVNTGASSFSSQNANQSIKEAPRPYQVRGRPIDDVVRELNLTRVDAIKIDVEGAEAYVLRGASNTLKRFHPTLVVEVMADQLARLNTTPADVIALIKQAGYNRSRPLNPEQSDWEWTYQDPRAMASTIQMADATKSPQLLAGFHDVEQNSWRWTAGKFSVALKPPPSADKSGAVLVLNFNLPEVSINKFKSLTLSANAGNAKLTPETFTTAGEHEYRREVPASALRTDEVDIAFSLDHYLAASATEGRELGIVVTNIGLQPK